MDPTRIEFKSKRKILFGYIMISVICIGIGSAQPVSGFHDRTVALLQAGDAAFIFLVNGFMALVWMLMGVLGLSLIPIIKFLLHMGAGPAAEGIHPFIYYLSSFSHGLCEWFVGYLVLKFTIEHVRCILLYSRNLIGRAQLAAFYKRVLLRTLPQIFGILLAGALLEVYVSNRLIYYFVQ
ncbi:hypothetical protein ACFFK0_12670 [Paenibacillus chartarius]|uniref:Stage II sporulation protein M n=1 Tax=Paenibacillus chartarius TaxID=747481 RepID=A0ABV6DKY5_9BACL